MFSCTLLFPILSLICNNYSLSWIILTFNFFICKHGSSNALMDELTVGIQATVAENLLKTLV